jgi:biopolymer transport protein TolR
VAVFVAGDAKANYQKVMDALVLLQSANVKKVGLMSQPDQATQGQANQGRR